MYFASFAKIALVKLQVMIMGGFRISVMINDPSQDQVHIVHGYVVFWVMWVIQVAEVVKQVNVIKLSTS